jgi:hypothetical protein
LLTLKHGTDVGSKEVRTTLARFEEVAGDNGGGDALTQSEREHTGAVEVTCRVEDTVVVEEAKEAEGARWPRRTWTRE